MIDTAEPKLRPKKIRSAGRDLTRTGPAPLDGERGPGGAAALGREGTASVLLTGFFLEDAVYAISLSAA